MAGGKTVREQESGLSSSLSDGPRRMATRSPWFSKVRRRHRFTPPRSGYTTRPKRLRIRLMTRSSGSFAPTITPQEINVVTSDATLADRVRSLGACVYPAARFRDLIDPLT